MQVVAHDVELIKAATKPRPHGVHWVPAALGAVPWRHRVQADAPAIATDPALQFWHTPSTLVCPARQLVQAVKPGLGVNPAAHCVQPVVVAVPAVFT